MKTFVHAEIVLEDRVLHDATLIEDNGVIVSVSERTPEHPFETVIDCSGYYLAPGFIEVHAHGGGGGSFLSFEADGLKRGLAMHCSHGVTTMLPTAIPRTGEQMARWAQSVRSLDVNNIPHVPGVFLEGPFTSPDPSVAGFTKGKNAKTSIDLAVCEDIAEAGEGLIKRWLVAPELDGADAFLDLCAQRGIKTVAGHSAATYEELRHAMLHGTDCTAHIYSAMSTVTRERGYRRGGLVEGTLLIDGLYTEMICDGHHLPPELIELTVKCKGYDRVMLVSDSSPFAGYVGNGEGEMLGIRVIIEDGVCKLPDRSAFAGSIACGNMLVKTVLSCGIPLWAAVRMASATPARYLGIDNERGVIRAGRAADLVLLDKNLDVARVYLDGKEAHHVQEN